MLCSKRSEMATEWKSQNMQHKKCKFEIQITLTMINNICYRLHRYEIMMACWQDVPESRPLFNGLEEMITNILGRNLSEHYVNLNESYLKAEPLHESFEFRSQSKNLIHRTDDLSILSSTDHVSQSTPEEIQSNGDIVSSAVQRSKTGFIGFSS